MDNLMQSKVGEINNLHKEVFAGLRTTIDKAIRIGELLVEIKKEIPHGVWMEFCKQNIEFSQGTVENYINCYKRKNDPKFLTVKNLTEIYYPQIEHKPIAHKAKEPKVEEPEPLPARLQPPVAPKVEEPEEEPEKEPEWVDEPLKDEQDGWVEDIKDLYVKLDDDHKELVIDWILEYKEAA